MKKFFTELWARLRRHLNAAAEQLETHDGLTRLQKFWLFTGETVHAIVRHQTFTLASALAFKTLLSIVPLLLIGMAVSMTLGTENGVSYADGFLNAIEAKIPDVPALQPLLDLLRDLAKRPREIAGIGFLMLFYTAYSLLASIDWCVNYIWQVEQRRPLMNRLVAYFLVIIIVPVLMSLSVVANSQIAEFVNLVAGHVDTVGASLMSVGAAASAGEDKSGWISATALEILSSLITCFALAVLIKLMPNTRVKFKAALWGGLAGGILIELTRYCFGLYTAHAAANLTRLYGSTMLFIPLTLLWLWLTWAFVLLGAEVAFAAQNYHTLALRAKLSKEGMRYRVYVALRLLLRVSREFLEGTAPGHQIEPTAEEIGVPAFVVAGVAADLCRVGLLREVSDPAHGFVPGKDLTALTVLDVARALQRDSLETLPRPADAAGDRLEQAFAAVAAARERELGTLTLRELTRLP